MQTTTTFDDIRPYRDNEIHTVIESLLADQSFMHVASAALPQYTTEQFKAILLACKTVNDIQTKLEVPFIHDLAAKCSNGVTWNTVQPIEPAKGYTYISNHRDIILDAGFLSVLLLESGYNSVEIAIGDNLFIYPWIKQLVRLNKSFIVQRGLSMRQMLEASEHMSHYIHATLRDRQQSVWIAQREGRAKDSNDRTQESVLKMLVMGGEGDCIDRLIELNVTPLTISYEYDPCDYLKAKEFQLKRDVEDYKKTTEDDMLNMQTGLTGKKGRIHFQISTSINDELMQLDRQTPKGELCKQVAALIDRHIHQGYQLYPGNYIADDLLSGTTTYSSHYSAGEKAQFEAYIAGQLNKIELPNKDVPFLYEKMLLMYSNPLRNWIQAHKQTAEID